MVDFFQFQHSDEVLPTTRGFSNETPLKIAVVQQRERLVRELLQIETNPNAQGGDDHAPCTTLPT